MARATQVGSAALRAPGEELAAHERAVAAVRAAVPHETFTVAWKAGRTMSPEQAAAEAWEAVADGLVGSSPGDRPAATAVGGSGADLTPREREVLRLVVEGRSDKEIAGALFISRPTASKHVAAILAKLGAPSRAAAVGVAVRDRLV